MWRFIRKRRTTESEMDAGMPQQSVMVGGYSIVYTIRRHPKAKHLRLTVTPFDGVVVTMPLRLPRYVDPGKFVRDNGDWVLNRLRSVGRDPRRSLGIDRPMRSGDRVLFRGIRHTIQIVREDRAKPTVKRDAEESLLTIHMPPKSVTDATPRDVLKSWMIARARATIRSVVEQEAERIGVKYGRLSVRDQKTKWGSCSASGNLSFNWRLILFPPEILRYIVVHELCHIRHFDHSIKFWRLVERYFPRYHDCVEWLRTEGLRAENLLV